MSDQNSSSVVLSFSRELNYPRRCVIEHSPSGCIHPHPQAPAKPSRGPKQCAQETLSRLHASHEIGSDFSPPRRLRADAGFLSVSSLSRARSRSLDRPNCTIVNPNHHRAKTPSFLQGKLCKLFSRLFENESLSSPHRTTGSVLASSDHRAVLSVSAAARGPAVDTGGSGLPGHILLRLPGYREGPFPGASVPRPRPGQSLLVVPLLQLEIPHIGPLTHHLRLSYVHIAVFTLYEEMHIPLADLSFILDIEHFTSS